MKKIMIRTLLHMHMLSSAMIGTTVGFDASASVGFDASASVPQLVLMPLMHDHIPMHACIHGYVDMHECTF